MKQSQDQALQDQLKELEREQSEVAAEKRRLGKSIFELNLRSAELKKDIAECKENIRQRKVNTKVSDHAIVRYLERVHGIDMKVIEKSILSKEVQTAAKMNADKIKKDGITYVLRAGTVVTII